MKQVVIKQAWVSMPHSSQISRTRLAAFVRSMRRAGKPMQWKRGRIAVDDGFYFVQQRKEAEVVKLEDNCPSCGAKTKTFAGHKNRPFPGDKWECFVAGDCDCDYAFENGSWRFFVGGIARR